MQETFGNKFGEDIPTDFTNLIEVLKVLVAALFTELKTRTEDFFRARKACRVRSFISCGSNLRADLLLKSSPFSVLLFQQSVVDTILAELRTADKDPGVAFGKKSVPKPQSGAKGRKRKGKGDGGQANKSFRKEQEPGANANQGAKGGKSRKRGKGKGKGKSSDPKPSTSGGQMLGGDYWGFGTHGGTTPGRTRGLTWQWFPMKPLLTNCKGQSSTSLLQQYIAEMLEMKAIVPTSGKIVQSRLFPVDKKGTT